MAKVDCSELARTIHDAIMNLASRPEVRTLDDAVTQYQKLVPGMNRQMVVDAIVEATETRSKDPDALANKINAIKREARQDKALQKQIKVLEDYIEAGAVPAKRGKPAKAPPEAIKALRDVRDGLKKILARSEPVQRERIKRQIADLTKRIETGDIYPKPKRAESPKSKELERAEFERDQLQKKIRGMIAAEKPKSKLDKIINVSNVFKSFRASLDLSAVRRQGGFFFMTRPWQQIEPLRKMFQAMKSERGMHKVEQQIDQNPHRALAARVKLDLAEIGDTTKAEDEMMSSLNKRIPGIAMSERAYVTFLNAQRMEMFSIMVETLGQQGEATLDEARDIANFINIATGRGDIGKLAQTGKVFNAVFFSLRYAWSRIQLATGTPIFQAKTPAARRLIAWEYGRFLIGMAAYYALWLIGADFYEAVTGKKDAVKIEHNPQSSDFGKIRIGNTRIDPLSGISQPWVLMSRLATGRVKSNATGEIKKIVGDDAGFGTTKPSELATRYIKYKLAPMPATIAYTLDREGPFGKPFGPLAEDQIRKDKFGIPQKYLDIPTNLFLPLSFSEIQESIQEQGVPGGVALGIMAILGEGIQNYGYEVDIKQQTTTHLKKELEKNIYKSTGRRKDKETGEIRTWIKGQPHKGKEWKVEAIEKELERRDKPKQEKNELQKVMSKVGIEL